MVSNPFRRLRSATMLCAILPALAAVAYNITGVVISPEGELMPMATVRLLSVKDSTYLQGTTTDVQGKFSLKNVKNGKYLLESSYVGYSPVFKNISVDSKNISADTLCLKTSSIELNEVSVRGVVTPIKVMEDTVEYSPDAFKTAPNAVVEDLLKRLPGVEVGTDGSITANGKSISKILVDGKEFFSDDPKVASKNLPVDMVDKLQVVDRKSDLARMTGVDDGEDETVINLTVKKDRKNGWFGNVEGGYGTDERYKGNFNVNKFWNGNQITLLGNFNNVNEEGFTDSNGSRFRRFGGSNGINTTQALGLNFNVGNEEIFRVGGEMLYTHSDRHSIVSRERTYLLSDSASYLSQHTDTRDKGHNIRTSFRVQWKPDSFNTFEFRPNLSLNYNDSQSSDSSLTRDGHLANVNRYLSTDNSDGHSFDFGAQLIYNHSFKNHRGRSFSVMARYQHSNVREDETSYSHTFFWRRLPYLLNDSIDIDDEIISNHTWSDLAMGRVSWTEPLGDASNGRFLTFAYRAQYRWNNADRLVYYHPVTWPDGFSHEPFIDYDVKILDDTLSNRFRNDYFNQDIRLGFKQITKTFTLDAGLSLVPQMSRSEDLVIADRTIPTRWVLNFAPFVRYRHKFSKQRSLNINYNGRSSQPSLSQLQPVADTSDPLKIVIGNPDLDPSFSHNIMANFQDFNLDAQRAIRVMGFASLTQNSIVSRTTFNASTGGQVTTYENVNGVWSGRIMSIYSQPLRNKLWSISNNIGLSYDHRVGFNNGIRNRSGNFSLNESFGLTYRPDNFEFELRPRYSLQTTRNSIQTVAGKTIHNYGGRFSAYYSMPFGLILNSDINYIATSGYSQGYNRNEWMWNASISYQTLADKSLTISLKAYDLLGQQSNISHTVSGNYEEDTRYNSLTRYVMATVSYRFNSFGKSSPKVPGEGEFNGPGGRHGGFGGPGGPGGPGRRF